MKTRSSVALLADPHRGHDMNLRRSTTELKLAAEKNKMFGGFTTIPWDKRGFNAIDYRIDTLQDWRMFVTLIWIDLHKICSLSH